MSGIPDPWNQPYWNEDRWGPKPKQPESAPAPEPPTYVEGLEETLRVVKADHTRQAERITQLEAEGKSWRRPQTTVRELLAEAEDELCRIPGEGLPAARATMAVARIREALSLLDAREAQPDRCPACWALVDGGYHFPSCPHRQPKARTPEPVESKGHAHERTLSSTPTCCSAS